MEHGKDVIAIAPNNQVHAYQLKNSKGGKIKLKYYQEELLPQILQLVHTPVSHPSVPSPNDHVSHFVTNGELEEEVFREIHSFNTNWHLKGQPHYKINTLTKGDLLQMALSLKSELVPTEVSNYKLLIDFHLNDGCGILDKGNFAQLLEDHFERSVNGANEAKRLISSGALLCSLATASFTNQNNHVPVVEAWILRFAEEKSLNKSIFQNEIDIGERVILSSLHNLLEELTSRRHMLEGSIPEDAFVFKSRNTWLLGFISSLGLYYHLKNKSIDNEVNRMIQKVIEREEDNTKVWGESAFGSLVTLYWYKKLMRHEDCADGLHHCIDTILVTKRENQPLLTSPYDDIDTSLAAAFGDPESEKKITFLRQESFYLWPIVLLLARIGDREFLEERWRDISKVFFKYFRVSNRTDFYRWRAENGEEVTTTPNAPESWERLSNEAKNVSSELIPRLLFQYKWLMPLFLMVYPHRVNADMILSIDDEVR